MGRFWDTITLSGNVFTTLYQHIYSECGSEIMRGNHTLLRRSILERAPVMANSAAEKEAVVSAVTEIFQINKANKLLQEQTHTYMIYNSRSWAMKARWTQWTSSHRPPVGCRAARSAFTPCKQSVTAGTDLICSEVCVASSSAQQLLLACRLLMSSNVG